jgi:hypothetical protein
VNSSCDLFFCDTSFFSSLYQISDLPPQ